MPEFHESEWIWANGEYVPWDHARLHVMSHVCHYGSSIFEGIRCYETPSGPAVFRLDAHLRRFYDSCRIHRMEMTVEREELSAVCREIVSRNGLASCYIRPLALRGYGAAGVDPRKSPVDVYVICWPWGAYLGSRALEEGVDVCVSSWSRPAPNTIPVQAKAGGNYLNAALMKMEATLDGYAEAIALGPGGVVSEGSAQNLFLVRDGRLLTPGIDGTILAGITRDAVLRLARDEGIPAEETVIAREMLYTADEAFFTGTAAEVTPVRSVDRIPVGDGEPGPVTRTLQEALLGIARGHRPDPYGWRFPVNRNSVWPGVEPRRNDRRQAGADPPQG